MSTYRAIGAVSTSMRTLLRDRMTAPKPVTIAPPGVRVTGTTGRRVNLFLYHVTENGILKNQEIPGRGRPDAYGQPPLSLNLHYLISVFDPAESDQVPDGADLDAQEILGDVMRVLHDHPVVHAGLRRETPPVGQPILHALLANEFEKVKLYLEPVRVEELADVWGALDADYRLSVGYEVSVVQVESEQERAAALPVQMRNVFVKTFRTAQITEVFRQPPLGGIRTAAAAVGETLRIIGTNLSGDNTRVTLGGVSQAVAPPVDDEQIDAVVPGTLPSGTHPVMIHHDLDFGTSTEPHEGFSSNVAAFVLIPTITNVVPPPSPGAAGGSTITVTLDPPVRPGQRISLLLGDDSVDANPLPPTPPTSATVQFVLPEAAGTHLMRVRVDGAESRLTFDPATSTFTGPTYTVT